MLGVVGRGDGGLHRRIGCHGAQQAEPLGSHPEAARGTPLALEQQARRAAGLGEGRQPFLPIRLPGHLVVVQGAEHAERLVHLVGAARLRPCLLAHARDGLRVELADVVGALRIGVAPVLHGLRAALLQRRVVEEGIGPRVQGLERERRGRGQVARQHAHRAGLHAPQQREPAIGIHRVVQAVVQRLRDQRMLGDLALADDVLRACDLVGKDGREQILGTHALQLRRHLAPAGEARQRERGGGVPAPAHAEQGRVEQRLHQHMQR